MKIIAENYLIDDLPYRGLLGLKLLKAQERFELERIRLLPSIPPVDEIDLRHGYGFRQDLKSLCDFVRRYLSAGCNRFCLMQDLDARRTDPWLEEYKDSTSIAFNEEFVYYYVDGSATDMELEESLRFAWSSMLLCMGRLPSTGRFKPWGELSGEWIQACVANMEWLVRSVCDEELFAVISVSGKMKKG